MLRRAKQKAITGKQQQLETLEEAYRVKLAELDDRAVQTCSGTVNEAEGPRATPTPEKQQARLDEIQRALGINLQQAMCVRDLYTYMKT